MPFHLSLVRVGVWLLVFVFAGHLSAQPASTPTTQKARVNADSSQSHPLDGVLRLARSRYQDLHSTLRDYVGTVILREHDSESMNEYHFLRVKVRAQRTLQGRVVTPFSVFLRFLAPDEVKDRKLLYVAGRNSNKILVRRGGDVRFSNITFRVSLDSPAVKEVTQTPISDLSLDRLVRKVVRRLEKHKALDPQGKNTRVQFYKNAKINGRVCRRIQILHPQKQEGLEFHRANVFIDEKLQTPSRVEIYAWPDVEGGDAPLLAEYTFTQVRINVGLDDADFHPRVMQQRR